MGRPVMVMIAGPNGAGKSTLYETVIASAFTATYINADLIQRDELNDADWAASYRAAEIAEERRQECLSMRRNFVTESTFSHPSKLALIDQARVAGFQVIVFHINVQSPELSVKRVAMRLQEGGHGVPERKIRERYARNQALIKEAVVRADRGTVYDNSRLNKRPARVIRFKHGQIAWAAAHLPKWARELYLQELEEFSRDGTA